MRRIWSGLSLLLLAAMSLRSDPVTLTFDVPTSSSDAPVLMGDYYLGGSVTTGQGTLQGPNYGIASFYKGFPGENILEDNALSSFIHQVAILHSDTGFQGSITYQFASDTPTGFLEILPMPFLLDKAGNSLASNVSFGEGSVPTKGTATITFEGLAYSLGLGAMYSDTSYWQFDNLTFSDLVGYDEDGPLTSVPEPAATALLGLGLVAFAAMTRLRGKRPTV